MSGDSTRISDLPNSSSSGTENLGMNGYMPINNHPNPFGNSLQQMPPQISVNKHISNDIQFEQRLPSRDIPQDTTDYTQDNAIKANYIPKSNTYSIEDEERDIHEYERKRQAERTQDTIITKIQEPIMIAILYFIFQMSIVNRFIYKYLGALGIHTEDGNVNSYGMILKSVVFGTIVMLLGLAIEALSVRFAQ